MESESLNPSQQAEKVILTHILSGEFAEGMRLPNTAELASQLNFGMNSVQQALSRLSTLGYLERRPRRGTFVRSRKKRDMNVVVLVGTDLKKEPHYFDRRLTSCLESELTAAGYIPHTYDNITALQSGRSSERERMVTRLVQDFTLYDPVGIIESNVAFKRTQELSAEFGRPSVSIKSPHMGGDVFSNRHFFYTRILKQFASLRRKRLVFVTKISGTTPDSYRIDAFWNAVMASPLQCVHVIEINDQDPLNDPEVVVREQMKLFLKHNRSLPAAKRADCMLVDEDILMRGVSLALLGAQVKIPDEFAIGTLTNEGIDLQFGVPVITYENPISKIAQEAVKLLTARILKEVMPSPVLVEGNIHADPLYTPKPDKTAKSSR